MLRTSRTSCQADTQPSLERSGSKCALPRGRVGVPLVRKSRARRISLHEREQLRTRTPSICVHLTRDASRRASRLRHGTRRERRGLLAGPVVGPYDELRALLACVHAGGGRSERGRRPAAARDSRRAGNRGVVRGPLAAGALLRSVFAAAALTPAQPELVRSLLKAGFSQPSPVQQTAVPLGRFGADLIVQARCGSCHRSACTELPRRPSLAQAKQ